MSDNEKIRQNIERLVASAIEVHAAALRKDIAETVLAELSAAPAAESSSGLLKGAIASIHEAGTQTDILRALLDGSTAFSERSGLLVVRGTSAQGWQSRGFGDEQTFRTVVVDCSRGLTQRAVESQIAAAGTISDFDFGFEQKFGAPHYGNVVVVPLVIKGKVAALVYADAGMSGTLDSAAVELLVESAAMWLEIQTLRRAAGVPETVQKRHEEVQHAPESAHAPTPAVQTPEPSPVHATVGGNGSMGIPTKQPSAPVQAANEDEVHTKARRFAKLLVDEIKLYNQAKVAEGRQARDLYERLKEDIEKSRATYQRRYGHVNDVDYFRQELVRVLADNDPAVLGASFNA